MLAKLFSSASIVLLKIGELEERFGRKESLITKSLANSSHLIYIK